MSDNSRQTDFVSDAKAALGGFLDSSNRTFIKYFTFPCKYECYCCVYVANYFNHFLNRTMHSKSDAFAKATKAHTYIDFDLFITNIISEEPDENNRAVEILSLHDKGETTLLNFLNFEIYDNTQFGFFYNVFDLPQSNVALYTVNSIQEMAVKSKAHKIINDELIFILTKGETELPPIQIPSNLPKFDKHYVLQSFVVHKKSVQANCYGIEEKSSHFYAVIVRPNMIVAVSHYYIQNITNINDFMHKAKVIYCVYSPMSLFGQEDHFDKYYPIEIPRPLYSRQQEMLSNMMSYAERAFTVWKYQLDELEKLCKMIESPSFFFKVTEIDAWNVALDNELTSGGDQGILVMLRISHAVLVNWSILVCMHCENLESDSLEEQQSSLTMIISFLPTKLKFCRALTMYFIQDYFKKLENTKMNTARLKGIKKISKAISLVFGKKTFSDYLGGSLKNIQNHENIIGSVEKYAPKETSEWTKKISIRKINSPIYKNALITSKEINKFIKKIVPKETLEEYDELDDDYLMPEPDFIRYQSSFGIPNPFW